MYLIGSLLVQKYPAEGRQEGPRRAALEAPVHVVRHEEQHAELLQRDQLHVALVPGPHLEPLQEGLGVHLRHGGGSWKQECGYRCLYARRQQDENLPSQAELTTQTEDILSEKSL